MTTIIVNKEERSVVLNQTYPAGKSAYELAVDYGFVGTEEEWVELQQTLTDQSAASASAAAVSAASAETARASAVTAQNAAASSASAASASASAASGALVSAALKANNLSDLTNTATARTNLGLSNVNNTSDANKPISTLTQAALNLKSNLEVPLFIFIGESNSEGRALNSSATAAELLPRPNLKIWNVDNLAFESLDIGSNNIWNDNAQFQTNKALWHGWELELANRGLDRIGYLPVYLVKAGQGGSLVADWDDVTDLNYTKFVSRVTNARNAITALGLIPKIYIFQSLGINDAIAVTSPATFLSRLTNFHANIRTFLEANTPIIQTQIMPNDANYIAINDKIIEITNNTNTFNVSVSGLSLIDANHWDYAGMKILANRLLDVAVDIVGLPGNKSGRALDTSLPTWDYSSGNAVTNSGISKTIVRPSVTASDWQAAPLRVEAFGNTAKFGYAFYNTTSNRFIIGGVTQSVSNDPVEIAPNSQLFTPALTVSGASSLNSLAVTGLTTSGSLTITGATNLNTLNVNGISTLGQINGTLGFFQFSSQNGATHSQSILRVGNTTNANSYGWLSHDTSDNITYFGSVVSGVAHKDIVLAPITPSRVGIGKKPTQVLDVNGVAVFTSGGFGTLTPAASSVLDVSSTTKGFLAPRMTTAQRNLIGSPSAGLQVYDTDLNRQMIYNGTIWGTIGALSGGFGATGTATTTFTVTIGATMPNTTYKVNVTPTNALSAALFYVTNKTTTTFDVTYLSGLTGSVAFDWAVFR